MIRKLFCAFLLANLWISLVCLPTSAHAFGSFTIKDEKELGDKFSVLIKSRMPLVLDPEVTTYVSGIVNRLQETMPPQPFPFTISTLRHNAVNAFATPGGYIFVFTGLILAMDNEDELAGVIAHEMAHVTQRHIASRIEQGQIIGLLSLVGALAGVFLGGDGGSAAVIGSFAAGQAAMLKHSRADENEADQVGLNFLTKAGYNPQGMVNAFKILGKKQWYMGTTIPTYLSTHPGINERVDTIATRLQSQKLNTQSKKIKSTEAFLRMQTLIRARYSDPDVANIFFQKNLNSPQKPLMLMGQGILWARQNKVGDAAKAFSEARGLAPDDALIIREAGAFHYTKGNRDLGENLLKQAITLNPKDIMATYYYSRLLADLGNLPQAIEQAKYVLRYVPEDVEIHQMLGRYYGQNKQMFQAYLHLGYASLYANNKAKVTQNLEKMKENVVTQNDKDALKRFEKDYDARKQFW